MDKIFASCIFSFLLFAGLARAETTLFDVGATPPTMPELDGRYYNDCGTVNASNTWASVIVNARDQNNCPTTVGLDVYDWSENSKNLTTTAGVYPQRCESDWWNYYQGNGPQALLRFDGLTAQRYELRVHVAYPSDPWVIGSGRLVCQDQSYYWDDPTCGPQVLSFTNLTPSNGMIQFEVNTWRPPYESRDSQCGIEVVELIGSIIGDFDGDGYVTVNDADALWPLFGTSVPAGDPHDLTGDGVVTFADAQHLVEVIAGTHMSDTDMDRSVGIMDLGNLADAYDHAGVFSEGDTNGDGQVDIMDLGNLADVYGQTFSPQIPEPATLSLLGACGWGLLRPRRRR